ncbi:hypothetical protein F5Y18DRAFT_435096 [Xylariaceae sp. FL1019]|nr:hypothetical protein F5Y18DRAFT_435096 [Xylariaceae sp. FL1019]
MSFASGYSSIGQPAMGGERRAPWEHQVPQTRSVEYNFNAMMLPLPAPSPQPAHFGFQPFAQFGAAPAFQTRSSQQPPAQLRHRPSQNACVNPADLTLPPYPSDQHYPVVAPAADHVVNSVGRYANERAYGTLSDHQASTQAPVWPLGHAGTLNNARIQQHVSHYSPDGEENGLYYSPVETHLATQGQIDQQPRMASEPFITKDDWEALRAPIPDIPLHNVPGQQPQPLLEEAASPVVDAQTQIGQQPRMGSEQFISDEEWWPRTQSQPLPEQAAPQAVNTRSQSAPALGPRSPNRVRKSNKPKATRPSQRDQSSRQRPREVGTRSCFGCRKDKAKCRFSEGAEKCDRCTQRGCDCGGRATVDKRTNDTTETELSNFLVESRKRINISASVLYQLLHGEGGMLALCSADPNNEYVEVVDRVGFPEPPQLAGYHGHHAKLSDKRRAFHEAIRTAREIWTFLAISRMDVIQRQSLDDLEWIRELSEDWKEQGVSVLDCLVPVDDPISGSERREVWNQFHTRFHDVLPTGWSKREQDNTPTP